VLFVDGIASGCFGSWKVGSSSTWSSREPIDPLEAQLIRQRGEQARLQRQAEYQQRQLQAARKARWRWDSSHRADPEHPYLLAKQVRAYGLHQQHDELLVPLYCDGQLVNLQRIGSDGQKRFMPGARVTGCYSPLGLIRDGQPLYVCEGWATGATLHLHGAGAVACAMHAGNLRPVALAMRAKYPDLQIIIAGDDDRQSQGNPGRKYATAAALAVEGRVTFPVWPVGAPEALSDFNDLSTWRPSHAPS
jgi:putative DNA primase/helicase